MSAREQPALVGASHSRSNALQPGLPPAGSPTRPVLEFKHMSERDEPPAVRLSYGERTFTVVKGRVPLRVGRHQENDLVLRDSLVSRFHATIRWDADTSTPMLYDNGSQNGTTLNGEPVRGQAVAISDGDRIQIGSARFDVELLGEEEGAPALIERTSDSVTLFSDRGPEIGGEFNEGRKLHDVLQQLEVEQRSGTLHITCRPDASGAVQGGQVTVCLGRLMAATWGDLSSSRALDVMLSQTIKLGAYNFSRELDPTEFPLNMWYSDFLRLRNAEGQVTRSMSSEVSAALRRVARERRDP